MASSNWTFENHYMASGIVVDRNSGNTYTNLNGQRNHPPVSTNNVNAPILSGLLHPNPGNHMSNPNTDLVAQSGFRYNYGNSGDKVMFLLAETGKAHKEDMANKQYQFNTFRSATTTEMKRKEVEINRLLTVEKTQLKVNEELQERYKTMEHLNKQNLEKSNVLRLRLKEQKTTHQNLTAELHKEKEDAVTRKTEITNLTQQLNDTTKQLEASEKLNTELRSALTENATEIDHLTVINNNLRDELATEKNEHEKTKSELGKMKQELVNVKSELRKTKFANHFAQATLAKLGNKMKDLTPKNSNENGIEVIQINSDSDESDSDELFIDEGGNAEEGMELGENSEGKSLKRKHTADNGLDIHDVDVKRDRVESP